MKTTHHIKPRPRLGIPSQSRNANYADAYWSTFRIWPNEVNGDIDNPTRPIEVEKWATKNGFTIEVNSLMNINASLDNSWKDRFHSVYLNKKKRVMLVARASGVQMEVTFYCPVELVPTFYKAQKDIAVLVGTTGPVKGRINLVAIQDGDFAPIPLTIPKPTMDLALNYGTSFIPIHADIMSFLSSKEEGLILLHGATGSGKSTYIYYLIHECKKKMIFIPNNMISSMANPEFVNFLLHSAKNSVIIVEDAEKVLLKRGGPGDQGVATLLNLTDGILGKLIKAKIICTFNIGRSELDEALLRKGRLRKEHEFTPLSVQDANKLFKHLGKERITDKPLTLAEIYNEDGGRVIEETKVGFQQ